MKKENKLNYKFLLNALLILLVIFLFLQLFIKPSQETEEKIIFKNTEFLSLENSTSVSLKVPAINQEGQGVATFLIVEATKGSGKTLVDIDNLLFWADTQHSIRIARKVAGEITNKNLDNFDLVYSVQANASLIGGPSAGSALTIATIAALEDKKPREDVMITGSINHDGSIGPVNAILEKAKAAKDIGASVFLVPLLQSKDVVYETTEHCEKFGFSEICTTETRPRKVDINTETGIRVQEISTIEEALSYFF